MPEDRVMGIFKFGNIEHIEQFVHEGHLYMNTLKYFRELESQGDALRADRHEGASHCEQIEAGSKFEVELEGKWIPIGGIQSGQIISFDNTKDTTKVYCMYALRESSYGLVDPLNFQFGDSYAVLIQGDDFLDRVHTTAIRQKLDINWGLVNYVDRKTYTGPMGSYSKFSDFDYQSEFRITIESQSERPLSLYIGDISDISQIGPLPELNKRIRIKQKES